MVQITQFVTNMCSKIFWVKEVAYRIRSIANLILFRHYMQLQKLGPEANVSFFLIVAQRIIFMVTHKNY